MTPEIGFVLILMLLWGPTALWLVYRAARAPRGRSVGFVDTAAAWEDRPQPATDPAGLAKQPGEGWVCAACYSVNRPRAARCYACGATPKGGALMKPAEVPTTYPGVAVMATVAPVARPTVDRPTPRVPVAATSVARTPSAEAAPGTPMPVMPAAVATAAVAGVARPSGSPATPARPLPPVPPAAMAPAPVVLPAAPDPGRTARAIPVVAPSACPFLGFKDDPSTRCDFPDPRNVCHASPRRLSRKAQAIPLQHQSTWCLTAEHGRCDRYPAALPSPEERSPVT